MQVRLGRFQSSGEIILLLVIFSSIAGYMFFVSMSFDTIDKDEGKCLKVKNSRRTLFGTNYTHIQLKSLSGIAKGSELLLRRLYDHYLKIYVEENFVFSPASIYTSISILLMNYNYDHDSLVQFQSAASILCDIDLLKLQMKKLFENEHFKNVLFLHETYDEGQDADVRETLPFRLTTILKKFYFFSEKDLSASDFQTTVEMETGYGEIKTAISTSGKLFPYFNVEKRPHSDPNVSSITFYCPNTTLMNIEYLKSTIIQCSSNGILLDIYQPSNELAFEIFKSRFGGFKMTSTINKEIRDQNYQFNGPSQITIPKVEMNYSIDLSMPLQMFGLINIFDEGIPRRGCDENLLSKYFVTTAKFNSVQIKENFNHNLHAETSAKHISISQPFFFSLRNNQSNIYYLFGYINSSSLAKE